MINKQLRTTEHKAVVAAEKKYYTYLLMCISMFNVVQLQNCIYVNYC